MANEIKPIQTNYNGYKFRSRLEARWAVFFDALGITYKYEPEGFNIDGECYLPDFYLPNFDAYVEVKPDTLENFALIHSRYRRFIRWGGPIKQLIFLGDVPGGDAEKDAAYGMWHFPALYFNATKPCLGWWFWSIDYNGDEDFTVAGQISSADYLLPESINPVSDTYLRKWNKRAIINSIIEQAKNDICFNYEQNSQIYEALAIARKVRFDHGETPDPKAICVFYKRPREGNWYG